MSRFIKVFAHHHNRLSFSGGPGSPREAWVAVDQIHDLVQQAGTSRVRKELEAHEYEKDNPDHFESQGKKWSYIDSFDLHSGGAGPPLHVAGLASEFVEQVTACRTAMLKADALAVDAARADRDAKLTRLTDRGVWQPGEQYEQLDVVAHPQDVSQKLVALQGSKSTSILVLRNRTYWCVLA